MKYIISFLLFVSLLACNDYPLDIWIDHDIVDSETNVDTANNDIIITQPIVFDTCTNYFPTGGEKFFCWWVHTDYPFSHMIYFKNSYPSPAIDVDSFFSTHNADTTITYYSGINIGGIVTGIEKKNAFANFQAVDIFGKRYVPVFINYGMAFNGAFIFYQYYDNLLLHENVKFLGFQNSGYSCGEVEQVIDFLLLNCKSCKNVILDLRTLTCTFNPDKITELQKRGCTVWQ